jgi:hypothetical protein
LPFQAGESLKVRQAHPAEAVLRAAAPAAASKAKSKLLLVQPNNLIEPSTPCLPAGRFSKGGEDFFFTKRTLTY